MEKERVTFSVADDRLTAHIHCEIDHHTARSVREIIDRETFLACPKVLVLDLSEVGFMDSSGIALILKVQRLMRISGGEVWVEHPNRQVLRVLEASCIGKLVPITIESGKE